MGERRCKKKGGGTENNKVGRKRIIGHHITLSRKDKAPPKYSQKRKLETRPPNCKRLREEYPC